ncbi:MAG: GNAT family N-acetyltransferase [Burkholderiales bacterium]|nr:GNAT family N-acetyltransferase [Burkholderiales bacterium]
MDITVERLTPSRVDDYLRFFDHEHGPAFADNPEWARCYCHYYHVAPALDWASFTGEMNQRAMRARIETGEMEGYLAYVNGNVAGWMNAQPYTKLRHACARLRITPPTMPASAHDAAAIVCFVVAPDFRRKGVSRALLVAGLANLAERGVAFVDAYPWNVGDGDTAATDHYHGSRRMFESAGFVTVAADERMSVMRKTLQP